MSQQNRIFLLVGIAFIFVGIIQGAFGAHTLQTYLPSDGLEKSLQIWKTGVLYSLVQGLGLILIVLVEVIFKLKKLKIPLLLIAIGTLCFSISIYCLVLNSVWGIGAFKAIFGPMTPVGGLLMIIGWLLFGVRVWKSRVIPASA